LLDEVLEAGAEVDDELATLDVVPDPVVVGLVEPPDEHDAMTRATPPIRVTATFRGPDETLNRPPRWSSITASSCGRLEAGWTTKVPAAPPRSRRALKLLLTRYG
jgi:hypothetical protein